MFQFYMTCKNFCNKVFIPDKEKVEIAFAYKIRPYSQITKIKEIIKESFKNGIFRRL